jgi:hypothetical protein
MRSIEVTVSAERHESMSRMTVRRRMVGKCLIVCDRNTLEGGLDVVLERQKDLAVGKAKSQGAFTSWRSAE